MYKRVWIYDYTTDEGLASFEVTTASVVEKSNMQRFSDSLLLACVAAHNNKWPV